MKKRRFLALAAALALVLTACGEPGGESAPPSETVPETSAPPASQTPAQTPEPEESVSPVYSDWSRLEPYEADLGLYTRYYDETTDGLRAAEGGYGALLPFAGAELEVGGGYPWSEYLWGLATADGTVVCDPVYDYVRQVEDRFLVLCRTVMGRWVDEYGDPVGCQYFTVAAADGSWVLEGEFSNCLTLADGRLLLIGDEETFWFCDGDGALERSPLTAKPSVMWAPWWDEMGNFYYGVACLPAYDIENGEYIYRGYLLANAFTGTVKLLDDVDDVNYWFDSGDLIMAQDKATGRYGFLNMEGEWTTPPQYTTIWSFEGDYAVVERPVSQRVVIDRSGNELATLVGEDLRQWGGYYLDCTWYAGEQSSKVHRVYDEDFRLLPDHPLSGKKLATYSGVPATREGDLWTIWDGENVYTAQIDGQFYEYTYGDGRGIFYQETDDGSSYRYGLYDFAAGEWLIPMDGYGYISRYGEGDESVYLAYSPDGGPGELFDCRGDLITRMDDCYGSIYGVEDGLIRLRVGGFSGWMDLQGNWVFRWPIRTNGD